MLKNTIKIFALAIFFVLPALYINAQEDPPADPADVELDVSITVEVVPAKDIDDEVPDEEDEEPETFFEKVTQTITKIAETVVDIAEDAAEVALEVTTTYAAPAASVIVGAALLDQALIDIPILIIREFSKLLSLFGFAGRKKPYGIVYDSITKSPISLAIVRIFKEDGSLADTAVTNDLGIFSVSLEKGRYRLIVSKPNYMFPSNIVRLESDPPMQNVYRGGFITQDQESDLVISIPIDPKEKTRGQKLMAILKTGTAQTLKLAQLVILGVGFWYTYQGYLATRTTFDLIALLIYIPIGIYSIYAFFKGGVKYGVILDGLGKPIANMTILLREKVFERVVSKRVTDENGRYRFVQPPGKYGVEVVNQKEEKVAEKVLDELHHKKKESAIVIAEDIKLNNG